MNARLIARLVIALAAIAGPAVAQDPAPTRSGEAQEARQAKAGARTPFRPGTVERVLTAIEHGSLFQRAFGGRDGLGVRVGGIENGAGLAIGPMFRASNLFGGTLQLHASGAASIAADREIDAAVALPHVAPGLALALEAAATHLAQERYFGAGMDSLLADASAFALDRTQVTGRATVTPAPWLQLTAGAGTLRASSADGRARGVPAIGARFTAHDAPGLAVGSRFTVLSLGASVDYRDVPLNPRRGGRYQAGVERFADDRGRHSFTRIAAEVEQHVPAWKRQRLLTLRAAASASLADRGHAVPFHLQPTLGGSRRLRGFVTDRFRDDNLLAFQAEYGWDVSPILNAVLFYEAGAVAPRWRDLSAGILRRDYGIGFRFGSARTVALRTDVALGSGEGTRISMRFNHAF